METTRQKEHTDIRIGTTATHRHDSRKLALDRYHQRMNEIAARLYKLPSATPAIRFAKYAETYRADTIAHHKGAERERELLKPLLAFFGGDLLSAIDQDRVRSYMTARRRDVAAVTVNREIDLLKSMLRDAVPKYVTASPIVGLARLKTIKPRRRLLLPVELQRLLKAADPVERALLILGYDGLIRLGDLLDLQPTDRRRGWLYVADPKADVPYEIALSRRAMLALDALPASGKYYFQRYRGAKTDRDRRARVRRMLMKLCAKANVPYGKHAGGITFHWATRRSGATRLLVKQKAPLPAVQRQGNWKTPDVLLSIYAEADRQDQQDAVFPKRSQSKRKSRG